MNDGHPMRVPVRNVQRLVVKIGSNVLTTAQHKPNRVVIRQLVRDVITLRERGIQIAIVTSGAVAAGMGQLGLTQRPDSIAQLQALASIGQNLMMNSYKTLFLRSAGTPLNWNPLWKAGRCSRFTTKDGTFHSRLSVKWPSLFAATM